MSPTPSVRAGNPEPARRARKSGSIPPGIGRTTGALHDAPMRTARLAALLAVASALAAPFWGARPAHAAPPVVSEGPRVRVETDVQSQATADKARAVVESALTLAEARLPYKLLEGRKISVHLHDTAEAFDDAIRVAKEAPSVELSTTFQGTRESHVLVAPRAEPAYLALVGDLPELTRYHLAFATVVQLLMRAEAPSLEWWPAWYHEGIAETIALDAVAASADAATPDAPRPLVVDGVLDQLREASATDHVLPVPRLLFAEAIALPLARRMQAHWVGLFRVLEAEPEKLAKFHDAVRRLPPPPLPELEGRDFRSLAYASACAAKLYEVFGPAEALDAKLRAYAASVKPRWFDVLHWSQFAGGELICAAPADSTAIAVSETPAPGVPFSVSCELQIHDLGQKELKQGEIYLGYERRDDPRFAKITFQPEYVTLLVYSDGVWQERMKVNVKVEATDVVVGAWLPVKLTVAGGVLRVEVRDKKLAELPAPQGIDLLRGRVGFGAMTGLVRFRKIVVAALPPPAPASDGAAPGPVAPPK